MIPLEYDPSKLAVLVTNFILKNYFIYTLVLQVEVLKTKAAFEPSRATTNQSKKAPFPVVAQQLKPSTSRKKTTTAKGPPSKSPKPT